MAAAQLLKSAREKFRAAGDRNGVIEVDASMTKIKADLVVKAIKAAREVGGGGLKRTYVNTRTTPLVRVLMG